MRPDEHADPASSGSTRSASTQRATIGRSSAAMNPDEQT
jgi:hypothetical protein